jgi:hypothetical protein
MMTGSAVDRGVFDRQYLWAHFTLDAAPTELAAGGMRWAITIQLLRSTIAFETFKAFCSKPLWNLLFPLAGTHTKQRGADF